MTSNALVSLPHRADFAGRTTRSGMTFGRASRCNVRGRSSVLLVGLFIPAQHAKRSRGDVLGCEAEVLHDLAARGRCSVVVDTNDGALVSRPLGPAHSRTGFDSNALFNAPGQDAFAIALVLPFEEFPAWHADHASLYAVAS